MEIHKDGKRYYVLYTQAVESQKVKDKFKNKLSGTNSEVFIPCMEYYKRGDKAIKVRPIFPNYIFIYSDLSMMELHRIVREVVDELRKGIRELGFKGQYYDTSNKRNGEANDDLILYPGISEEETVFLDFLRQGNGLLTMSAGYEAGKKSYVVMEGPLKAYQDKIVDVDKHNRKAFLSFEINGRIAQAGFECKPKAHWFPNEKSGVATLSDGSEVDLEQLKRDVMKI